MKKEHQIILELIRSFLEKHPDQRFGQALFNLKINEFQKTVDPKNPNFNLREIYNDEDEEIVNRIRKQLDWLSLQKEVNSKISNISNLEGMTINERLNATGLMEIFDKQKESNSHYAKYILRALKVDSESIYKMFNRKE